MAAPAPGSGPGGSSGVMPGVAGSSAGVVAPSSSSTSVNPFLSDSEEEEEEEEEDEEDIEEEEDDDDDEVSPADSRPGPQIPSRFLPEDGDPPVLPPLGPRCCPPLGESGRIPLDAVAAQLLRDQLLLTALEMHTELLESGRELPRLRDYFSNPGNFERPTAGPPPGSSTANTSAGGN